jgi:hypothetical protein
VLAVLLPGAEALVACADAGAHGAAARALRAQVRQVAGAFLLRAREFGAAEEAFGLALGDAGDPLIAVSVVAE